MTNNITAEIEKQGTPGADGNFVFRCADCASHTGGCQCSKGVFIAFEGAHIPICWFYELQKTCDISGGSKMVEKTKPSALCLEKAAQAWCEPETSHITKIPELAEAFARILEQVWSKPWLGNATTAELIDEVKCRCEMNGTLEYRTVTGEDEVAEAKRLMGVL